MKLAVIVGASVALLKYWFVRGLVTGAAITWGYQTAFAETGWICGVSGAGKPPVCFEVAER